MAKYCGTGVKKSKAKQSQFKLVLSDVEWSQTPAFANEANLPEGQVSLRSCQKRDCGDYSVISHAKTQRAKAVIIMKTTIEANKITTSFRKFAAFIFGSFVALYTMAIAATNGSSHSMDCGVTPIFSGIVKVATTKAVAIDILASDGFDSAQMSQINGVHNTQEVEQTCYARVYLSDFIRSAVNRIMTRRGQMPQGSHCRRIHDLCHIPRLRPDGVNNSD